MMAGIELRIETPRVFEPLLYPARYKGTHGGRASGKSHFFAELLVESHIMTPGLHSVCVREIQKSLDQSVKKLLEDKIEKLGVGKMFVVQDARIITPGNGLIIFQGMQNHTAESIKSLEGYDIAWCEEAQSLSQRSLDLLRPTIRKEGSELWFSWNPHEPTDPIDVLLRGEELPKGAVVVEANHHHNPFLSDVIKQEIAFDRKRDFDKYLHTWEGQYRQASEARVFKNWEVKEFTTHEEAVFRFGADWGFANDPTVLVRCYVLGKKMFIDYEAVQVGCDIDHTPDLFASVPESNRWPIIADCSRPETISYMQRHGFSKIQGAIKGKDSIEEGIEFLRSFDIIVHPRCVETINEFKKYSYKTDPLTDAVLPVFEDKNNHVIDALRYSAEAIRRTLSASAHQPKRSRKAPDWRAH